MASLSGGDKLEKALAAIAQKAGAAGTLRVGFLEGSTYPDGTPVPLVAAINEYGKAGQPPRPFFRTMIAKRAPKWPEQLGKIAAAADFDMSTTLERMGQLMAGQLQKSIRDFTDPALSPVTIARKGFSKPLIDTGHMLNSVSYEVTTGDTTTTGQGSPMSAAARGAMTGAK